MAPQTSSEQPSSLRPAPGASPVTPAEKRRARRVFRKLREAYPDAETALVHRNAFELLVATILSAQCTDVRVNQVTPELFRRYPDPASLAAARPADVEALIRSTGFYRNKTKSIQGAARRIVETHGGAVPETMEALTALPGVARKTANCVLGNAFGKNVGVVVDTHVKRLAGRLGFTEHADPVKVERDLMARFPRRDWTLLSHLLIAHGRAVCKARAPACERCLLRRSCPKRGVSDGSGGGR